MPSTNSISVAFIFGSDCPFITTCNFAFGSSIPAPNKPLGL